jgi:hypothetical protein
VLDAESVPEVAEADAVVPLVMVMVTVSVAEALLDSLAKVSIELI